MKSSIEKQFIHCGRKNAWMYHNDEIALRPREYCSRVRRLDDAVSLVFDIVSTIQDRTAGEIALRVGEGPGLFYLGHVGYHVDPPYQGRHFALQACRLCLPVFAEMGQHSFVITTDEDNFPSVRTCEALGCVLESTVDVPPWCVSEFQISRRKRRYVYDLFSS